MELRVTLFEQIMYLGYGPLNILVTLVMLILQLIVEDWKTNL